MTVTNGLVNGQQLIVPDPLAGRVLAFSLDTGQRTGTRGVLGSRPGELTKPSALFRTPEGFGVTDMQRHHVVFFDAQWRYLSEMPSARPPASACGFFGPALWAHDRLVGSDGSFAIEGLDAGAYTVRLVVGQSSTPAQVVVPDLEQYSVTLRFPGGTLAGRVVDEQGAGVRFAQVQACNVAGAVLAAAVSGEDGAFQLAGLAREGVEVKAQAHEFEPSAPVAVEAGQTPEPVVITLHRAKGGTLSGALAATQGLVGGAPVALFGPTPAFTYADLDGSFEFKALAAGTYRVCARPLGGACGCGSPVQVTSTEPATVSLTIGEGGWVQVDLQKNEQGGRPQVVTAEGQDITSLLFLGNPWESGEGFLRFGPLVPGVYRVHPQARPHRHRSRLRSLPGKRSRSADRSATDSLV
jgi:hypothetical protein